MINLYLIVLFYKLHSGCAANDPPIKHKTIKKKTEGDFGRLVIFLCSFILRLAETCLTSSIECTGFWFYKMRKSYSKKL